MRKPLYLIGALILIVVTVHVVEYHSWKNRDRSDQIAFQEMVGGLGMGATPAVYWDYQTYDPRLEPNCACELWPVPGGYPFSPEHGTTIWHPPGVLYVEPVERWRP
jgi:hypothetical protein